MSRNSRFFTWARDGFYVSSKGHVQMCEQHYIRKAVAVQEFCKSAGQRAFDLKCESEDGGVGNRDISRAG